MKLIFGVYLFLFCNALYSQDFDNYLELGAQFNHFDFQIFEDKLQSNLFFETQDNKNSILYLEEKLNQEKFNFQLANLDFKSPEKRIDFNRFLFNCSGIEQADSKDLMISAFKYYILNKYVFGSFLKTEYKFVFKNR